MSQIVFIDEDELKKLQMYKNIAEQYRKTFEKVYPILLPEVNNFILSNPIKNWEYDCYLLEDIIIQDDNLSKTKKGSFTLTNLPALHHLTIGNSCCQNIHTFNLGISYKSSIINRITCLTSTLYWF